VPGIDLILGAHDHFYHVQDIGSTHLVKAGMDFKWMAKVTISILDGKPKISSSQITMEKDTPEDEVINKAVAEFKGELEAKMQKELGTCKTELDCTRPSLRTGETNIGNFFCDIIRIEFDTDVSFINAATIRTEKIHPPGPITLKTLLEILPFQDIIITAKIKGADIWGGLENGVSKLPVLEGRFPQVSGLQFTFDSTQPVGERVLSLTIGGENIERNCQNEYTIASNVLMLEGKDGYDTFKNAQWTMEKEDGQLLSIMIINHFRKLRFIQNLKLVNAPVEKAINKWKQLNSNHVHASVSPSCDGRIIDIAKKI